MIKITGHQAVLLYLLEGGLGARTPGHYRGAARMKTTSRGRRYKIGHAALDALKAIFLSGSGNRLQEALRIRVKRSLEE